MSELPTWTHKPRTFKGASFQQTVVGKLHRIWFPTIPFTTIQKAYRKDHDDDSVSWAWYSELLEIVGSTPRFAFWKNDEQWSLHLADLLSKPLNKLPMFAQWEAEAEPDGLFFPLIGRYGVLSRADEFDEISEDAVVKFYKDDRFIIELLPSFARRWDVYDIETEYLYQEGI